MSRLLISLIRLQFVAAVQLIMLRRCPRTSSATFHEIMNGGYFYCRQIPKRRRKVGPRLVKTLTCLQHCNASWGYSISTRAVSVLSEDSSLRIFTKTDIIKISSFYLWSISSFYCTNMRQKLTWRDWIQWLVSDIRLEAGGDKRQAAVGLMGCF